MTSKERSVLTLTMLVVVTLLLSACTQSLSSAPEATPTLIPTGLFVSPVASVENPMEMIEQFAKQTEAAQTAAAGGTPGTPGTPQAGVTGTPGTPGPEIVTATPSATVSVSTPTNANSAAVTPNPVSTTGSVATSIPPAIASGSEYVLRDGEYPYCIARRYNVDPEALLKASGLTSPDIYYAGMKLVIPQSGPFPGQRYLKAHPASYTVQSGDETIYSIACQFGDVDPNSILSSNPSITASSKLTVGQVLQIP